MKYYLIAGEASGDLHGSNLMRALKRFDKEADFRFFGGDLMKSIGGELVKHYRELAFMGLVDVVSNLRTISSNLKLCKRDLLKYKPDALILIDYAGFNLRIAEFARNAGLRVYYYISPKVWVWKKSRIKKMKKFTEKIFVIFPFEVDFFRNNELEVEYYGNPLMDSYNAFKSKRLSAKKFREKNELGEEKIVALLSGSREHEVKRCLPEMLKAASAFPEYRFVIAGVPSVSEEIYRKIMDDKKVDIVFDQTYQLLNAAKAAIVTSGTATLETAIFKVPQVVIYKTSSVNFVIGRPFIRIRFFSLVNLIAGKEVVKELLQFKLAGRIRKELGRILEDREYKNNMLSEYDKILLSLGNPGSSERVAARITEMLKVI
jgi:lipid-A-disaccharide synthase